MTRKRRELGLSDTEIARRYVNGDTIRELAESAGASFNTIRKRLSESGVAFRPAHRPKRDLGIRDECLARLYNEGYSLDEIAASIDEPRETIRKRLRSAGVNLRPTGGRAADLGVSDEELARRYSNGESIRQLADSLGKPFSTVNKRLKKIGVTFRPAYRPKRDLGISDEELVRLYTEGQTIDEIATSIDRPHEPIRRRLISAGVKLRPTGRRKTDLGISDEKLARLYVDGQTLSQIADSLGKSRHIVHRRLVSIGVNLRPSGAREADLGVSDRELARRYSNGETIEQLADSLGNASSTIYRRLKRVGVTFRPAHPPKGGPGIKRLRN